jgi:hypothetical protein
MYKHPYCLLHVKNLLFYHYLSGWSSIQCDLGFNFFPCKPKGDLCVCLYVHAFVNHDNGEC